MELKYLLCFSWTADIITELLQSVCFGGLTGGNREGELNWPWSWKWGRKEVEIQVKISGLLVDFIWNGRRGGLGWESPPQ